ncbi:DUF4136 domain-containing protein [Dyadobacter sandarakinus]|uniref:DUF4136 domain-containing protein n=1 Tax=Dyadobacter sandarakinus TaxID=2747268 RepID=A0ABX7IBP5_9BACT|nr:DUF4136 domain-containing protein [Dyadobacter sandarakinus]QRR03235.1 DUF4136 domain-containing protein [Dyadobacter sandarakinus]
MKTLQPALLLCLALAMLACGPSYKTLKTKKEAGFHLSDFTTFGFYDIEATGDTIPENFEKNIGIIRNEISKNLQAKGLDEARDPGLKINIAISVEEKLQTRQTDYRTDGYPRYMGQRRYSWKSQEVVVGKYREGTIILDLVDAANNKLMWQGGAEGILSGKDEQFQDRISPVIKKIIDEIP